MKTYTSCDSCAFAEYQDDVQIGCVAGRLEKLKSNGAEIELKENENGQKFYVIMERICTMCRGEIWKHRFKKLSMEEKIELARREIVIPCTFLIYIGPDHTVKDAIQTARSIEQQKTKSKLVIYLNNCGIEPADFMIQVRPYALDINWRMEYIIEFQNDEYLGTKDSTKNHKMWCRSVDIGVQKTETIFYSVFNAGSIVPPDYLSTIDNFINDNMERLLALEPDDEDNGLLIYKPVHSSIGGNKDRTCLEKIKDEAAEQECPNLVRKVTEVIPSMLTVHA